MKWFELMRMNKDDFVKRGIKVNLGDRVSGETIENIDQLKG